jgi:hypothetical protein
MQMGGFIFVFLDCWGTGAMMILRTCRADATVRPRGRTLFIADFSAGVRYSFLKYGKNKRFNHDFYILAMR